MLYASCLCIGEQAVKFCKMIEIFLSLYLLKNVSFVEMKCRVNVANVKLYTHIIGGNQLKMQKTRT
jgi:hypothetical protein